MDDHDIGDVICNMVECLVGWVIDFCVEKTISFCTFRVRKSMFGSHVFLL